MRLARQLCCSLQQQQHSARPLLLLVTQRQQKQRQLHMSAAANANAPQLQWRSSNELEEWLAAHGVPVAEYGRGAAKTVADLFEEVARGESVLSLGVENEISSSGRGGSKDGSVVVRAVSVVALAITRGAGGSGRRALIEARQRLPDGRERARRLPPSEKLLAGEGWRAAAERCVAEELAPALPPGWRAQLEILDDTHTVTVEARASTSYPGLSTVYTLHRVAARLPCAPAEPFVVDEPCSNGSGTLRTWWEWIDGDDARPPPPREGSRDR